MTTKNKHESVLSSFAPGRSSLDVASTALDIVEDPSADKYLTIVNSSSRADAIAAGWRIVRENIPSLSQAERILRRLRKNRSEDNDRDTTI